MTLLEAEEELSKIVPDMYRCIRVEVCKDSGNNRLLTEISIYTAIYGRTEYRYTFTDALAELKRMMIDKASAALKNAVLTEEVLALSDDLPAYKGGE